MAIVSVTSHHSVGTMKEHFHQIHSKRNRNLYTATQILQYITEWVETSHGLTSEDIERRLDAIQERTERIQKIESEMKSRNKKFL